MGRPPVPRPPISKEIDHRDRIVELGDLVARSNGLVAHVDLSARDFRTKIHRRRSVRPSTADARCSPHAHCSSTSRSSGGSAAAWRSASLTRLRTVRASTRPALAEHELRRERVRATRGTSRPSCGASTRSASRNMLRTARASRSVRSASVGAALHEISQHVDLCLECRRRRPKCNPALGSHPTRHSKRGRLQRAFDPLDVGGRGSAHRPATSLRLVLVDVVVEPDLGEFIEPAEDPAQIGDDAAEFHHAVAFIRSGVLREVGRVDRVALRAHPGDALVELRLQALHFVRAAARHHAEHDDQDGGQRDSRFPHGLSKYYRESPPHIR